MDPGAAAGVTAFVIPRVINFPPSSVCKLGPYLLATIARSPHAVGDNWRRTRILLNRLGECFQAFARVTKQHARVFLDEQRIIDASITGRHAAFEHHRGMTFPDL